MLPSMHRVRLHKPKVNKMQQKIMASDLLLKLPPRAADFIANNNNNNNNK
jgi:hypothetical protein